MCVEHEQYLTLGRISQSTFLSSIFFSFSASVLLRMVLILTEGDRKSKLVKIKFMRKGRKITTILFKWEIMTQKLNLYYVKSCRIFHAWELESDFRNFLKLEKRCVEFCFDIFHRGTFECFPIAEDCKLPFPQHITCLPGIYKTEAIWCMFLNSPHCHSTISCWLASFFSPFLCQSYKVVD